MLGEDRLERLVDECGLAGATDTCDEDELSQGKLYIDVLEVVACAAG